MALISQPGSDYQIVSISLDAGYTRDLILLLTDVHAVLDHLYLDGTQPEITSPAGDYLRESASPYTLPALIDAPGEVTGQLSHADAHPSRHAILHQPTIQHDTTSDPPDPRRVADQRRTRHPHHRRPRSENSGAKSGRQAAAASRPVSTCAVL
jgi:hypothetical protein